MTAIIQTILLAVVVVYCALEQLGARRWRRNALEVQEKQFKAALATWARVAGKTRLQGEGRGSVLAPGQQEQADAETDFRAAVEQFTHPPIVMNGADRA